MQHITHYVYDFIEQIKRVGPFSEVPVNWESLRYRIHFTPPHDTWSNGEEYDEGTSGS